MIIQILTLIAAFPIGLGVATLTKDEIYLGKKWLFVLLIAGIISAVYFYISKQNHILFTCLFVSVFTLANIIKSARAKSI